MQRSKVEVFVHMAWATRERLPLMDEKVEMAAHRSIGQEVTRLQCIPLAINGMLDHVHLVVQMHSTIAIARLAQAVKGVSSRLGNYEMGWAGAFDWQDCYAALSLSHPHLQKAIAYVRRQKEHHAHGNVWDVWEETARDMDEAVP